jgi:hypothetical protein
MDRFDGSPRAPEQRAEEELVLRYARAADVRKDQLGDERYGLMVRTQEPLRKGDRLNVVVELAQEKLTLRVAGEVRWVTPLIRGALAGVALVPGSHRETVQLDLLFGRRSAGPTPETAVAAATAAAVAAPPRVAPQAEPVPGTRRPLSVAMLQPDRVLRQVLENALHRFGQEQGGWDVTVEAHGEADAFLEALAARPRGLAIVDCDVLGAAADALVAAIRSHDPWARLPLILLSSSGGSRIEDGLAVYLRKPVAMKAFADLAGILVGRGL